MVKARSTAWLAGLFALVVDLGAAAGCTTFSEAVVDGGSDGAGGAASPTARCAGGIELGAVATFSGKVNVHMPATPLDDDANRLRGVNSWYPDPDCTSGADQPQLPYCRRFWPSTTDVAPAAASAENKPFLTKSCGAVPPSTGQALYVCCQR